MTTIAWDGKALAADREVSVDATVYSTTKILRTTDGRLLGAAGLSDCCAIFMDWLANGGPRPPQQENKETCVDCIEILPSGEVRRHYLFGYYKLENPFVSCGAGANFALAAMLCGKDAEGAVKIANLCMNGHEGRVDVLFLNQEQHA